MRDADEVARELLGNIAGPLRHIFGDAAWLDALDVLIAQEAEHLADLIRARDAAVAAEALREAADGFSDPDDPCHDPEPLSEVAQWLHLMAADRIEREGGAS